MTVVDDLSLLASLLPPALCARYRVQLVWAADANKDIGFKFSSREELTNGEMKEDRDLQLRDFNLVNFNQSSAPTTCVVNGRDCVFAPESQEPNPGRHDTEIKNPKIMIDSGDQQNFNAKTGSSSGQEKRKCNECNWEGNRKAYGMHKIRVHGTRRKLTRCENCGTKSCTLFPHKCRLNIERKSHRRGIEACGTCGLKTSDLRSHVLLRHSKKEQYLFEHYNVKQSEELMGGYNCQSCGKHFSVKSKLWKHICIMHGVITKEEINAAAMGKDMVEDQSLEKRLLDVVERRRPKDGAGTCGTCGFKASNLRCHVLLRHSKKDQYLKEHYNIRRKEQVKGGYNCHYCGKHVTNTTDLWRHICSKHGVITQEEIDQAAVGKIMVEDNSCEKDQTMKPSGSNMLRPIAAAASEEEHQSGGKKQDEEKEECNEGKWLNAAVENKEEACIGEVQEKRKRKALREASPACDYERIRAANIAERMELLRTLDMERAVAGAKEGSL